MAALLVMSFHFCQAAPNAEPVTEWFQHMMPLLDMFFVLSGFLIYERYAAKLTDARSVFRFLIRRLARLYPLHLITLSVFVVAGVLLQSGLVSTSDDSWATQFDFSQLLSNLLLIQAWGGHNALTFNYVSWSISGEWFAYLFFPLIALLAGRAGLLGLSVLLIVLVTVLQSLGRDPYEAFMWYEAASWGAWRILVDFIFGAMISIAAARLHFKMASQLPGWALVLGATVLMHFGSGYYTSMILIGFGILLAAMAERQKPNISNWLKPVLPIASLSFGIYLWHPVIQLVMIQFVWSRFLEPMGWLNYYVWIGLMMLVTIAVAILSFWFFEKPVGDRIAAFGDAVGRAPQPAPVPPSGNGRRRA